MLRRILPFITVIFFYFLCAAYEVDSFTKRYDPLKDSTEILNSHVNRLMKSALDENTGCDPIALENALSRALDNNWLFGTIEILTTKDKEISKHEMKLADSVYNGPSHYIALDIFGLEPTVLLNGNYVGADKFGHFFDQGHVYYSKSKSGQNTDEILKYGIKTEDWFFGSITTGIKSYGDLNANYSGWKFWKNISSGPDPYFRCQNNSWAQVRTFTWADYVNPGWDEGINCSEYASKDFQKEVLENQKKLENLHTGKKYTCPVDTEKCLQLTKLYRAYPEYLIGPDCLNAAKSAEKSSTPSRNNFTDKKYSPGAL